MLSLAGHTEICSPTFNSDPQKAFSLPESLSLPLAARSYRSRIELKKAKNPSRKPILPNFKKHTLSLTLKQTINSGI